MGEQLDKPIKKSSFKDDSNEDLEYGICTVQGWRKTMEDTYLTSTKIGPDKNLHLFGVFDGHGGIEVANFVSENFTQTFTSNENFKIGKYKEALKETFLKMDELLKQEPNRIKLLEESLKKRDEEDNKIEDISKELFPNENITEEDIEQIKVFKSLFDPRSLEDCNIAYFTGCTACIVFLAENEIYFANAGDSYAFAFDKNKKKIINTTIHKPTDENEKKRIELAGYAVKDERVNEILNLSRAIGDLEYKQNEWLKPEDQAISANPEISSVNIKDVDYVVLCCDGVKDVVSDEDLIDFCLNKIENKKDDEKISQFIDGIYQEKILEDNKSEINKITINNNNNENNNNIINTNTNNNTNNNNYKNKGGKDNMTCIIIKIKDHCKIHKMDYNEKKKKEFIEQRKEKERKKKEEEEKNKKESSISTEIKEDEKNKQNNINENNSNEINNKQIVESINSINFKKEENKNEEKKEEQPINSINLINEEKKEEDKKEEDKKEG